MNRARVRLMVAALVCFGVAVVGGHGVSFGNAVCDCPVQGDPDGNGTLDFFDVSKVMDVAIFNVPATFDPDCPRAREDLNCDSLVTIGDVLTVIDWTMIGVPPTPCDACDCINDPPSCQPQPPAPGQAIIVESKQVTLGQTAVEVGVYLQNDVSIRAIVVPLEFREITSGAYISGSFEANLQGRLSSNNSIRYFNDPDTGNLCSGPSSNSYGLGSDVTLAPTPPTDAIGIIVWDVFGSCLTIGSDGTPGSGTPSILLTFDVTSTPGTFEIDTCCTMPASHVSFIETGTATLYLPTFTKGIITIGTPVGCTKTTTDPYLLACPRGDIPFEVHLKDDLGDPMVGYSDVQLDFSDCTPTEFFPLPGEYPSWPIVPAPSPSDADGVVRFSIAAGGLCSDCEVTITTGCGFTTTVPVRSTDVDGDAWVLPLDYDAGQGLCRDLNADGVVDDRDYSRHLAHCCDHKFPGGPCDWLSQDIELTPVGGFAVGDTIEIRWLLDNNPQGNTCQIDSVVIYEGEWKLNTTWDRVDVMVRGVTVGPGGQDADSLVYEVPDFGKMCLRAVLYTDCCATPQIEKICTDVIRQCPPDAFCYEFRTLSLTVADETFFRHDLPLALDWTFDITTSGDTTITLICTSDITPVGTEGTLSHYYRIGAVWDHFTYRVAQVYVEGDLCGAPGNLPNCQVDAIDLACLIDYVFFGGPPPFPAENADINCDGFPDAVDLSTLIDFVFFGGDAPPDCGDGPGFF